MLICGLLRIPSQAPESYPAYHESSCLDCTRLRSENSKKNGFFGFGVQLREYDRAGQLLMILLPTIRKGLVGVFSSFTYGIQ